MEPTKRCRGCQLDLPARAYAKQRGGTLGVRGTCKSCTKVKGEERKKTVTSTPPFTQVCTVCGISKWSTEYFVTSGKRTAIYSACKPCHSAKVASYRQSQPSRKSLLEENKMLREQLASASQKS